MREQWIRCNLQYLTVLHISTNHREGQGFIFVYSITSRSSFERLEVKFQDILKVKGDRPVFMLVGNECEKQYQREVSREEGAAKARELDCKFLETSAKTAQNVEKLFTDMVRMLRSNKEKADNASVPPVKSLGSKIKSMISRGFRALRGTGEKDKKKHGALGG